MGHESGVQDRREQPTVGRALRTPLENVLKIGLYETGETADQRRFAGSMSTGQGCECPPVVMPEQHSQNGTIPPSSSRTKEPVWTNPGNSDQTKFEPELPPEGTLSSSSRTAARNATCCRSPRRASHTQPRRWPARSRMRAIPLPAREISAPRVGEQQPAERKAE